MPRRAKIDWTDVNQRRAYKAGYMRGVRTAKFIPQPGITELAYRVMCNEYERARYTEEARAQRGRKKKPKSARIGNAEWQALGEAR